MNIGTNNESILEKTLHSGTKCKTDRCTENLGRWAYLPVCDLVFGNISMIKNIPWAAIAAIALFVAMGIVAHLFGK
jgi:hypothetical protein